MAFEAGDMNPRYREPRRVLDEAQIQRYRSTGIALQKANYKLDQLLIVLCRSYRNVQRYRGVIRQIATVCGWMNLLVRGCEDIVAGVTEQEPEVLKIIISRRCECRTGKSKETVYRDNENQPRNDLAPNPGWILQVVTLLGHINRVATYLFERGVCSSQFGGGSDCLRKAREAVLRQKGHLEEIGTEETKVLIERRADRCRRCESDDENR
jgi:hypothetical protein